MRKRKQKPLFEWQVTNDEAEWNSMALSPQQATPNATASGISSRSVRRWLWAAASICLLLAVATVWFWRTAEDGVAEIEGELQSTAQLEAVINDPAQPLELTTPAGHGIAEEFDEGSNNKIDAIWQQQFRREQNALQGLFATIEPGAAPIVDLHVLTLKGEQAVTKVVIHTLNGSEAYRQSRFYRHTAQGWLRTAPLAELWGAPHTLESAYFLFHYRQNDAAAVKEAAAKADLLYATLRHTFALTPTLGMAKHVVDVRITELPGTILSWEGTSSGFSIPSPALYLAPPEVSDADLLVQSIGLPLLERIKGQAISRYAIQSQWLSMLEGLQMWQSWELHLPLSAWYDYVIQQGVIQQGVIQELMPGRYVDKPLPDPSPLSGSPARTAKFCVPSNLWPAILLLHSPALCDTPEYAGYFFSFLPLPFPTQLPQLAKPAYGKWEEGIPLEKDLRTRRLAATLVAYAVESYGRERLPVLVAGMGQYSSWETLIPAVYGVSPAHFEAGWREYLAVQDR